MKGKDPLSYARMIWTGCGMPPESLSRLHLSRRADPSVDSHFRLGTAAQTSIGLSALAAARFHELRTGIVQDVSVDPRHAIIAFNSEKYYLLDDALPQFALFDDLAGMYRTRDGFVRLHTNFPHHKQGLLDILGCSADRSSIANALQKWDAAAFEQEAMRRGMCAVALRRFDELQLFASDQNGLAPLPIKITKIADAPKRATMKDLGLRGTLEGIRVADMTRVLAGPVCGRTLAEYGADVLLITSPKLPALPALDIETSRGKRTAYLDLDDEAEIATLRELLRDADVFLQAYRPGGLASRGFSPDDAARLRPGVVYASLSAYPPNSIHSHVRGFDSLVQTMSGMNHAEAEAYARFVEVNGGESKSLPPFRALPMQALDHAAGYFLAFGISSALCKTIEEGGSWHVEVSLYDTMQWIRSLGLLDPQLAFRHGRPLPPRTFPPDPEIAALHMDVELCSDVARETAAAKKLTAIRPAAVLEKSPPISRCAPMQLGAHSARWRSTNTI